jgi:hypothetical protein
MENARPALKLLRHIKTRHETTEYRWRCLSSRYNLDQSFVNARDGEPIFATMQDRFTG